MPLIMQVEHDHVEEHEAALVASLTKLLFLLHKQRSKEVSQYQCVIR